MKKKKSKNSKNKVLILVRSIPIKNKKKKKYFSLKNKRQIIKRSFKKIIRNKVNVCHNKKVIRKKIWVK